MKKNYTFSEVRNIVENMIGKTFGELNNYKISSENYNKGSFGFIMEEDVFKYGKNTKSELDIANLNIELKMTPYKINKNGTLSAKERLVLNIINYMTEYKNDFYDSHFWFKNKLIQIVWYRYEDNKPKSDFLITDELLFKFPKEDLPIIINDWYTIINKIKLGLAHEISEADTMYLGACTKGENSKSEREQPFSDIRAKQRAFSLKSSYMTQLVRNHVSNSSAERIITDIDENISFEQIIENKIKKYRGKSVIELKKLFGINSNSKNVNELIVARMLNIKGKVAQTDEFIKANIIPKTIRINSNGSIKESMSFPSFDFIKISKEKWYNSELYEMFSTTKYMFVVFREVNNDYIFSGIKFWNMPNSTLNNEVKDAWSKTVEVIKNGNVVKDIIGGKKFSNFPGMADNSVCHVRPHARNANDVNTLPIPDNKTGMTEYTKHCFWLNSSFISEIVKDI
ncbi:Sau3AI family type II restriction endonuclease [Haploplasma modicum]|uniref:Sau3AI family type II restriction endonuclease n=1 Tax=Haploplasma modicum TaxID=2150 RepID=UPI000A05F445|nr:Sau3AI family type II restriction endonuclease [Haploplasma modicum]